MSESATARVAGLSCWRGAVTPEPLGGGITNTNFTVVDRGERFVVRIGDDIPVHGVMRFNELAAARAAADIGLSPEVVHHEPGALVMRFVEGRTLTPDDVRAPGMLARILPLLKRCHDEMPNHFQGPALVFWVFQVIRDYARTLRRDGSRMVEALPRLESVAADLEAAVGPVTIRFGHNDLLAANFIDDGGRLWLIDWDYAGFNSPLFDLANLAANNEFALEQAAALLDAYFEQPADTTTRRGFAAMKCASLLREAMWSMVSELHSSLDFDYTGYTDDNLARFEAVLAEFQSAGGKP